MKRILSLNLLLAILFLNFSGCSKEKDAAKSMEQLHKENGVPVRIETVQLTQFSTRHSFHAVLTGIKESTASAMISDKVENILKNVGDKVQKDEVVITFPTDNPAAQYHQAKVGYEHAKSTMERMENLFKNGGISQQDFENAKTQYQVAQANWDAVKQTVRVQAPISGIISSIKVQESDNVKPGDALFTVSQTQKLKAKIWVSEEQVQNFKPGNKATAAWNGIELTGKIFQVDMSLNTKMQAFGVGVEFDNGDGKIMSGVNAEVTLFSEDNGAAVVVERKNIIQREDHSYVFVAEGDIAKLKEIQTGKIQDLDIVVLSGLNPGEKLITQGQMLLQDKSKIKIIEN